MEVVVRVPTGIHRVDGERARVPGAVPFLYAVGLLAWAMPIGLVLYYRANAMGGSSVGWRALGVVLAAVLAMLVHTLSWAGAFFYGRLVTSDQIAQEAERSTNY